MVYSMTKFGERLIKAAKEAVAMRNLKEHPVTKQEIIDLLGAYEAKALQRGGVGDMTPLLLREAMRHVRASKLELSDLGTVQDSGSEMG